ncbi:MAG: GNAT family N-acetyltransferase, partial [Thermoproteota archaeon]
NTDSAELALVVRDDWQGRGVGTALLNYLIELAKVNGFRTLRAWVLVENATMMHLFRKCGYRMKYRLENGVYEIVLDLSQPTEEQF